MNYGKAIRELRLKSGQNQTEYSLLLGISQTYLSQLENGLKKPSTPLMETIAQKSGVPMPILLWQSLTEEDVPEHKRESFRLLAPHVNDLIVSMF